MKLTVVRYRTKPETADENASLVQAMFQELHAKSPDDLCSAEVLTPVLGYSEVPDQADIVARRLRHQTHLP